MAERKQTPDILAEILGGAAAVEAPPPVDRPVSAALPAVKPSGRTKAARPDGPAKPVARAKPVATAKPIAPARWEHRIASFQEHRGWRLRFVDGIEAPDWTGGPTILEYLSQAGDDGWQLAGACSGQAMFGVLDRYQVFLRRAAG